LTDLLAGKFSAALFTTGVQIDHFLEFAASTGQREAAKDALSRVFIGSIGPTCTETLRAAGLEPALVGPSHPKMGILVREAALKYAESRS
jgi:uroporphyrinogen-III synthase